MPPCRKNQKVLCEKTHRGRINRGTTSVFRILTEYGLIRHGRTSRLMPPHCNVCTRRSLRFRFGALLPECISCALPYRLAPSGGSLKGTAHYFFPITAFLFSEYHNFFRLSSTAVEFCKYFFAPLFRPDTGSSARLIRRGNLRKIGRDVCFSLDLFPKALYNII